MSAITWTEETVKSKIGVSENLTVAENIKYPLFRTDEEKYGKTCKKMNDFYGAVVQKYSNHIRTKLVNRLRPSDKNAQSFINVGMKFAVTCVGNDIISVVLDLYVGNGERMKMKRFSQMWSTESENMIFPYEFIRGGRRTGRKILSKILPFAEKNAKNPSFGYYGDYARRLKRNLRIANCFAVPSGLAFFVQPGDVRPEKYGSTVFVLPYKALCDVVNGGFLEKKAEKDCQNGNIVNNV